MCKARERPVSEHTRTNFSHLRVWQSALDLAEIVYRESAGFPVDERFGIRARCVDVSYLSLRTSEGRGRFGTRQFAAFLDIAHGSLRELEALVLLAARLKFISSAGQARVEQATHSTIGQLLKLAQHLRRNSR